jgi:HK97 family phage major capsid protein
MGIEEIRNSKEYINAFANYIKTGKDEEVRALLSTNATVSTGYVPVPEIVEDRIRTAWQKLGFMDLVRKSYAKGNLKVGFELSADGALVHAEGANANNEEALTLGVVELKAESIKKWITISDEAMDMSSEAFLDYIYDEITYRIAKKAQEIIIAKITAASTSASSTAVSVAEVDDGAPSVGIVAECLGKLSDEAVNPVILMNKATWSQFKAAQYAASYAVDPFEGLPVYFDNTIPAYSSTATTGAWLIVGDPNGAQANFPAGEEIGLKYDDLSLAEKDLVKIVGREYVGLGVVADKAFCRVTMHT